MVCYDFLLFIHILGDVPFSKGIKADFERSQPFSLVLIHLE